MRQSDVLNWVMDECETVLSNVSYVSVSSPSEHVDEAQSDQDHGYPFVGVRPLGSVPQSAGLGSGEYVVDSLNYGNDGIIDSIDYRRDSDLTVEVIPTTDGRPSVRDDLGDDIYDHFGLLARRDKVPEDITLHAEDSSPSGRPDDQVRATGVTLAIEFSRYITESVTAAETVNLDVDVTPEGTLDDESDDVDAFDDSV